MNEFGFKFSKLRLNASILEETKIQLIEPKYLSCHSPFGSDGLRWRHSTRAHWRRSKVTTGPAISP